MHFAIGTTNKPKTEAVEHVLKNSSYTMGATFSNHKVPSWVPDMPTTLEELRTWAKNRAVYTRRESPHADYFIGMEWGVYQDYEGEEYWFLGVVYIEDRNGKWYWWYSEHLRVPDIVLQGLLDGRGRDLEEVMEEITWLKNVWDINGSGWVWSDGHITRQDKFVHAILCALVPHFSTFYK